MFTGLIEAVGHIEELHAVAGAVRLRIGTTLAAEMRPGDSLAVDGVCLTATAVEGGHVLADVGPETLRVTTLGSMRAGQLVNLERAMRADARFGGHFVQGHVDGTGAVKVVRDEGESHWVTVSFDEALAAYCIPKGSIAAGWCQSDYCGASRPRIRRNDRSVHLASHEHARAAPG